MTGNSRKKQRFKMQEISDEPAFRSLSLTINKMLLSSVKLTHKENILYKWGNIVMAILIGNIPYTYKAFRIYM